MAVQAYTEVPGMTTEMYDGMFRQAGDKLTSSPGFIAHISAPIDGGMSVTELWESQEAMDTFINTVVIPMMEAAGMPRITPQVRPIHNVVISAK